MDHRLLLLLCALMATTFVFGQEDEEEEEENPCPTELPVEINAVTGYPLYSTPYIYVMGSCYRMRPYENQWTNVAVGCAEGEVHVNDFYTLDRLREAFNDRKDELEIDNANNFWTDAFSPDGKPWFEMPNAPGVKVKNLPDTSSKQKVIKHRPGKNLDCVEYKFQKVRGKNNDDPHKGKSFFHDNGCHNICPWACMLPVCTPPLKYHPVLNRCLNDPKNDTTLECEPNEVQTQVTMCASPTFTLPRPQVQLSQTQPAVGGMVGVGSSIPGVNVNTNTDSGADSDSETEP